MDKGTWYVACHAWLKGEDGKKVFGQWSEIHKVDVSAITPQAPVISKVTVKGSTVTVKYTKSKNAQGYDVVLSDTLTKTNGQKCPAVSGENYYVKKIKGNTVTVTFKNVNQALIILVYMHGTVLLRIIQKHSVNGQMSEKLK